MGWTFSNKWQSKQDVVNERTRGGLVPHRLVGTHLWYIAEATTGHKIICLDRIMYSQGEYGYKAIDETMHPFYYDCPLSLLKQASPVVSEAPAPDGALVSADAARWRERVHEHHADTKARRASVAALKAGDMVHYGGRSYTLQAPIPGRRAWRVINEAGRAFRMSTYQLGKSQKVA